MNSTHTIWFRSPTSGTTVKIVVATTDEANQYWDELSSSGFYMVSTRPSQL